MCGTDAALAVYCPLGGVTLTALRVAGSNVLVGQMRKLRAEPGYEAQAAGFQACGVLTPLIAPCGQSHGQRLSQVCTLPLTGDSVRDENHSHIIVSTLLWAIAGHCSKCSDTATL